MVEQICRIAITGEAPADFRIVSELTDRLVCQEIPGLDAASLSNRRRYCGSNLGEQYLDLHDAYKRARERRLPVHGRFNGEGEAMVRSALLLFADSSPRPNAVIVAWDMDGAREEREKGMLSALDSQPWPFAVVMAKVGCKRESWVLSGYTAENSEEAERHAAAKRTLGFDPCVVPERLTASSPGSKRSAKRVLDELTNRDYQRESRCWQQTDLALLEKRGQGNGLADFLQSARRLIVPLFEPVGGQLSLSVGMSR